MYLKVETTKTSIIFMPVDIFFGVLFHMSRTPVLGRIECRYITLRPRWPLQTECENITYVQVVRTARLS